VKTFMASSPQHFLCRRDIVIVDRMPVVRLQWRVLRLIAVVLYKNV
jgi:hypothetical protein